MSHRKRWRLVAALVAGSAFVPALAEARSPQSAACARAAEDGQALRDEGKLTSAKEAFGRCIRSECPSVIAKECASWLDDVTERQPSIVVAVKDANGNDIADATVLVDGIARDHAAAGRATILDPGSHVVATVIAGTKFEQRIVVREREKDRRVTIEPPREVASPPPVQRVSPPSSPRLLEERPVPVVTYVLSGVSVLLGSVGAGFGISAASDYANLRETCPSQCTEAEILGLRAKTVTADIAVSLAVAAAIGAVVVYLVRPVVVRQVATPSRPERWTDLSRGIWRF